MSNSAGPKITTSGLILGLDAANQKSYTGAGIVWSDLNKKTYNGTLSGTTFSNNAFSFNGTTSYCYGGDTSIVNGNYAIDVWFKATGVPSINDSTGAGIFIQSNALNHGIAIFHSWTNQSIAHGDKVNDGLITSNGTALNNTICNVIGQWDGTTQSIYINGNLSNQRAYVIAPLVSSPAYQIGRWGYSTFGRYFNGLIYNVKLYNKALSSKEVYNNFVANRGRFGV